MHLYLKELWKNSLFQQHLQQSSAEGRPRVGIDAMLICLEAVLYGEQQLAVLDTTPALLLSGTLLMADKLTHQDLVSHLQCRGRPLP